MVASDQSICSVALELTSAENDVDTASGPSTAPMKRQDYCHIQFPQIAEIISQGHLCMYMEGSSHLALFSTYMYQSM